MSNFISQNEVNDANELLKVQQPHLENCITNIYRCITNTALSPVTKVTVMGKFSWTKLPWTNFPS